MITLTIPGEPVAKGRPRFFNNRAITPKKTVNYETLIQEMFIIKYGQTFVPLDCPLSCDIRAFFPIPNSWSNKKKTQALQGEIKHTKRPDIDNLIKCLDGLNGIAFRDDSLIVEVLGRKEYAEVPRLEIEIREA